MKKIIPFVVAFLLLPGFMSAQSMDKIVDKGNQIYQHKCSKCHGNDGTRRKLGAKNLKITTLSDQKLYSIIADGKRMMPRWKKILSHDEILAVVAYVKTLKNT